MSEAPAGTPDVGVPLRLDGVRVRPAHLHVPPRASSATAQVLAVAEMAGRQHEPEQILAIERNRQGLDREALASGQMVDLAEAGGPGDPDEPPLEVIDHALFDEVIWPALARRLLKGGMGKRLVTRTGADAADQAAAQAGSEGRPPTGPTD